MQRRQFKVLINLILILALVVGCTALLKKEPATPEEAHKMALLDYDAALQWYTKQARIYEIHYQAADPELQAKWKTEIDPIFFDAKDALDIWGKAVKGGGFGKGAEADFEEQYTKLLLMGLDFLEDR